MPDRIVDLYVIDQCLGLGYVGLGRLPRLHHTGCGTGASPTQAHPVGKESNTFQNIKIQY